VGGPLGRRARGRHVVGVVDVTRGQHQSVRICACRESWSLIWLVSGERDCYYIGVHFFLTISRVNSVLVLLNCLPGAIFYRFLFRDFCSVGIIWVILVIRRDGLFSW
jgi:hypothetical protein